MSGRRCARHCAVGREPDTKLQAAGHGLAEQDMPSLMVSEDGSIVKIMQDKVRGNRELQFYACLELCRGSTEHWCSEMRRTLQTRADPAHLDAESVIRYADGLEQALKTLHGVAWCIPRCCMLHLRLNDTKRPAEQAGSMYFIIISTPRRV